MENLINLHSVVSVFIYSIIGCGVFAVAFKILDLITPNDFWTEILEEHNSALAIIVGCLAIGLSLIISSAMRG